MNQEHNNELPEVGAVNMGMGVIEQRRQKKQVEKREAIADRFLRFFDG